MDAAWAVALERIVGAATLGAAIGLGVSWDFDWSTKHPSRNPLDLRYELVGLLSGTVGSVAACWLGFALLDVGPLAITVPSAMVLVFLAILQHLRSVPGGNLHPVGRFAYSTALAFFAVGALSTLAAL
jgi:hypothetical protein